MRKVLIVTYYWPPAGGIAVQRTAKFCKYLPNFGWEPIILTVKSGNFEITDNTFEQDIKNIKHVFTAPSLEPHSFLNKTASIQPGNIGNISDSVPDSDSIGVLHKIADFIRLNVFIPDSRIGWLFPAYSLGKKIIRELNPALIYSTAPPYTAHIIARKLAEYSNLPWVADYRDPWLENINYNTSYRFPFVKYLNKRLEKRVLDKASEIVVVGPKFKELYVSKLPANRHKNCHIIRNGIDLHDLYEAKGTSTDHFYVTNFGTTYSAVIQESFFTALRNLAEKTPEFTNHLVLRFIGKNYQRFSQKLSRYVPDLKFEMVDYLPHKTAVKSIYQPQLLLLFIGNVEHNEIITTGKLFDYLPTGNPILGIGPVDGDAATILRESGTGEMFDYDSVDDIEQYIRSCYQNWLNGNLQKPAPELTQFSREHTAQCLANLFDQMLDSSRPNQ